MASRSASASSSRSSTDCAERDVLLHERPHAVVQHGTAMSPRRATSNGGLSGGCDQESDRALGDVHRLVADALEIGVDLDDRTHQPQVGRDRILQREELDAQVVDLELELVDLRVAGGHLDRQVGPALDQRRERIAHARLDELAHGVEPVGEAPQLLVKMALHQPNLPVM